MFDIPYIFGVKPYLLDSRLNDSIIQKNNAQLWIGFIQRYQDAQRFAERHSLLLADKYVNELSTSRKFIVSYGYLLFNYLNLDKSLDNNDTIWLIELFDTVYNQISGVFQERLIRMVEALFVKCPEARMPYKLAYGFLSHPLFRERYLAYKIHMTSYELELKTIMGRLLCSAESNIEHNYQEQLFTATLERNCQYFNDAFQREPNVIYHFFYEILVDNWSKTQVNDQVYIADHINSYTILCNSMVILNYILTSNTEYSIYRLPVSNYTREGPPINTSIYNKLYWLIFDYYKVSFYSLILQNMNNQNNIMLTATALLSTGYRQNIDANNKYLKNANYNGVVCGFFMDMISLETLDRLPEDVIYEVLFYINYAIEYKTCVFSKVSLKYIVRFLSQCLLLDQIVNPFIKIKVIKVLYLLDTYYDQIDIRETLGMEGYRQMFQSLVKISLYIDKMPGLDVYGETFFYKTYILNMLCKSLDYLVAERAYFIMIMSDVDSIIHYTISTVSSILLQTPTVLLETYNRYEKTVSTYLTGVKLRVEYIYSQLKSNPILVEMDLDIKYHLIKYLYGILKNCYDQGSVVIKVKIENNLTGRDENKIWASYKNNVLEPLARDIEKILCIPEIVEMVGRFYPDLVDFFKSLDKDLGTDVVELYRVLRLEIKDMELPDEMPEEFLDPILFTPIRDPVILPDSQVMVDRAVIHAHLVENEYDPFNRQPLKMERLDEYNKLEEQHQTIMDFIKRRDDWINRYHSHNE